MWNLATHIAHTVLFDDYLEGFWNILLICTCHKRMLTLHHSRHMHLRMNRQIITFAMDCQLASILPLCWKSCILPQRLPNHLPIVRAIHSCGWLSLQATPTTPPAYPYLQQTCNPTMTLHVQNIFSPHGRNRSSLSFLNYTLTDISEACRQGWAAPSVWEQTSKWRYPPTVPMLSQFCSANAAQHCPAKMYRHVR